MRSNRPSLPPPSGLLQALSLLAPAATSMACGPSSFTEKPQSHASAIVPEIPRPPGLPRAFEAVARDDLCVTTGEVESLDASATDLYVNDGGMRSVLAGAEGDAAELSFVYEGPSDETTPLGNGEIRRQIGLRLRAQDTCNMVYVMWHESPRPGVFVSVKRNPSMHTHAECRDGGYINLAPARTQPAPIASGERHRLRAEIEGSTLRVHADDVLVWEGALPPAALSVVGPVGVRSDNGRFDFELRVRPGWRRAACPKN